nr:CatB-related O-acetyltransferase [uncultured Carboxylicivirga sp.]
MTDTIRKMLWRLLGVDRNHLLKSIDYVFLKNDPYTFIGKRTYDNGAKLWRWTNTPVLIGKYCSIANNVNFIVDGANHSISRITAYPIFDQLFKENERILGESKSDFLDKHNTKRGIEIGNDVWIGMGAIILPGVKIGNGVTIAAGSVVTKDIEDYCIVAGVPARIVDHKCDVSCKRLMNEIAWWDWEDEKIKINAANFMASSIEEFIMKIK